MGTTAETAWPWLSNHPTEREIDRACAVEKVAAMRVRPTAVGRRFGARGRGVGTARGQGAAAEMRETEKRRASVLERARALAMMDDAVVARTSGKAGAWRRSRCGRRDVDVFGVRCATRRRHGERRVDARPHVDDVMRDATELMKTPIARRRIWGRRRRGLFDVFRACATATRGERLKSIHASPCFETIVITRRIDSTRACARDAPI